MYPAQLSPGPRGAFFDAGRCPDCGAPLAALPLGGPREQLRCGACGLPLSGPAAARLAALLFDADRTLADLRSQRYRTMPPMPVRPPTPAHPAPAARQPAGPASVEPMPAGPIAPARLSGLNGAVILLSLGALCLVVAAVVFLSMSWTSLTLDAKVAVLAGVTGLLAATAGAVSRRGLRGSAEALWAITLIDLALDVWAARRADLAGLHSVPLTGFTVAGSALVATAALACCQLTRRGTLNRALVSAQLVLGIGGALSLGRALLGAQLPTWVGLSATVLGLAGLAMAARAGRLAVTGWVWSCAAALAWCGLAGVGIAQIGFAEFVPQLWHGQACELPAAIGLALAGAALDRLLRPYWARLTAAIAGIALAALAIVAACGPYLRPTTGLALALLAVTAASWLTRPVWRTAVSAVLAALATLNVLVLAGALIDGMAMTVRPAGWLWQQSAQLRLGDGGQQVPAPSMLALLAVTGAVLLARRTLLPPASRPVRWVTTTAPLLVAGIAVSAHPTVLVATLAWLAAAVLGALVADRVADGRLLAVPATALALGVLSALQSDLSSLVAFGVAGLLAVLLAWRLLDRLGWRDRQLRTVVELSAVGQLFGAVAAGCHRLQPADSTPAVAGLLACGAVLAAAAMISPSRRWWQWLALSAITAASWIEAAAHQLHAPELYSVPLGLLVLGLGQAGRAGRPVDQAAGRVRTSWQSYGLGLLILTTPSLLLALGEPLSWRAPALGVAALALVLLGGRRRLQAPLLIGAAELALLALRELGPYALAMPRWAAIGATGLLLLAIGISWEARLADLRRAQRELAEMR